MGIREKMAVHALNEKMGDLLEPLLEGDEESSDDDESSMYSSSPKATEFKATPLEKLKSFLVTLGLMAAEAASVVAIILDPGIMVYVMAGITILNAPFSAYKEYRVMNLPSLRSLNKQLRESANHLQYQVEILVEEIESLQPEAERASVVEEELRLIADEQNTNVDKLVALVKENESIVALMQDSLRRKIVQDVLKIVMLSDANNSGDFCKVELKMLVLKIRLQLSEYGVEFNEQKFYKLMSVNPSVECALNIVMRLIPSSSDEESDGSEEYEDCNDEDDNDNDDDPYDMFYVLDRGNSLSSLEGCPVGRTSLRLLNERRRSSKKAHTNQGPQKTKVQNLPSPSQEAPTPIKLRKRDKLKSLFIRGNR